MSDRDGLRRAMVEHMMAAGTLRTPQWVQAFATVPRHLFLPRFFRQTPDHTGWQAIGESDPDWPRTVYTDATWVTQLDNDPTRWDTAARTGRPARGVPTSSSTAPGLMALMLEALDIDDGHTVLEIGTGTGYNAALLSHRLGARLVTTVEVDPTVAEAARLALLACGYTPTRVVGDGAAGHADGAPYDRIIATCSTATIPPAWAAQVRPGGLVLTNLHRDLGGGALVLLRRDDDGQLDGRFLADYGAFMPVRCDPPADAEQRLTAALTTVDDDVATKPTSIDADALDHPDFGMLAALRLPGVTSLWFEPDTGPQRWLLADDGSWACVEQTTRTVRQHGARRLWHDLERLHQRWRDAGQPPRHRFGLSVTDSGIHRFWLDDAGSTWWTGTPAVIRRR
ncbi:ATP-grasp peptide maturase system methyltransferase [Rhizomonospora bruguierae]|uniref:ATP-grasp peptide maturase system methyltransferase n=1 Tax=Rhizomonospora bruguierae TaxID=1581705 RepID=UPI0020BDBE4D|nr:ATP-grasp peptide maturase system methyltransferase [Micromonospora sp. NBRC 107566]